MLVRVDEQTHVAEIPAMLSQSGLFSALPKRFLVVHAERA